MRIKKQWFTALPPIISTTHVFISLILFSFEIEYQGSAAVYIGLPVFLVIILHILIVINDRTMGITERIAYGFIHLPFCVVFAVSSFLLFSLHQNASIKVSAPLECLAKVSSNCLPLLYSKPH